MIINLWPGDPCDGKKIDGRQCRWSVAARHGITEEGACGPEQRKLRRGQGASTSGSPAEPVPDYETKEAIDICLEAPVCSVCESPAENNHGSELRKRAGRE